MFQIDLADEQTCLTLDEERLREAVEVVLKGESIDRAEISLAVVDDATIRRLNRQYLDHDYATDVLSFLLDRDADRLEGEVVVSAETAHCRAEEFGWSAHDELLLYVVHGTLHLAGYLDGTSEEKGEMRSREAVYLAHFGLTPHDGPSTEGPSKGGMDEP